MDKDNIIKEFINFNSLLTDNIMSKPKLLTVRTQQTRECFHYKDKNSLLGLKSFLLKGYGNVSDITISINEEEKTITIFLVCHYDKIKKVTVKDDCYVFEDYSVYPAWQLKQNYDIIKEK